MERFVSQEFFDERIVDVPVPESSSKDKILRNAGEQIFDGPVPLLKEWLLEVPGSVSQDQFLQLAREQTRFSRAAEAGRG